MRTEQNLQGRAENRVDRFYRDVVLQEVEIEAYKRINLNDCQQMDLVFKRVVQTS